MLRQMHRASGLGIFDQQPSLNSGLSGLQRAWPQLQRPQPRRVSWRIMQSSKTRQCKEAGAKATPAQPASLPAYVCVCVCVRVCVCVGGGGWVGGGGREGGREREREREGERGLVSQSVSQSASQPVSQPVSQSIGYVSTAADWY